MPDIDTVFVLAVTADEDIADDLERSGVKVKCTRDGFDAVQVAATCRPDLVILDSTVSGLPCQTVALWLKLNPATSTVPVIAIQPKDSHWDEVEVDGWVSREKVGKTISMLGYELARKNNGQSACPAEPEDKPCDPVSVSLDLIELYRERLRLASSMIDIASLQNDQRDFEFVIKSVLEAAGNALCSPLMAIALPRHRALYMLVREKGPTGENVEKLEKYCLSELGSLLENDPDIDDQIVFGRRKLQKAEPGVKSECHVFGHAIGPEKDPVGYLAGICSPVKSDISRFMSLIPDLNSQISRLLNTAETIREQEENVGELATVLRAAVETSKISPYAISSNREFLLQYLLIILDLCESDRGLIVLLDEETKEIKETATVGCDQEAVLSAPLQDGCSLRESLARLSPSDTILDHVNYRGEHLGRLIAPMTLGEKVLGCLIILGIPSAPRPRLNQALKTLSSLGGYLLYNRSVHQSAIDSAVLEEQLKLAREIQEDLIPENHPDIPGYDIFGASVAAKQVGGDFFEYLPFDDGRLGIAIGDVSGKAIPASLLMAMTRALVVAASERSNGPEQVLRDVNVHLSNRITNGRFVTASLLTIDGGDLCYASAGHPPLMLYHADTDSFEDVNADGIAMGIIDQMEFERVMSRMEPGDIAIMYTDGLNEAMDRSRREFGYENIRRVVRESADRSAREIVDALYRAIEDHVDGADLFDDTTVVVIKHTEDSYKDS